MKIERRMVRNAALVAGGATIVAGAAASVGVALAGAALWKKMRGADLSGDYGRVDILVNNAGVIMVGPLKNQTLADFQEAMDTMFWGMVYPTLAFLPQMFRRGEGRIVNITSMGGRMAVPHMLPYNCAKFAAVGFSEGLHAEVKKDGIIVTTVAP